jgi:hypothetical protein
MGIPFSSQPCGRKHNLTSGDSLTYISIGWLGNDNSVRRFFRHKLRHGMIDRLGLPPRNTPHMD